MASLLRKEKLIRLIISILFSMVLALGTNIDIANAANNELVLQDIPGVVKGLSTTVVGESQVYLRWTAVSGATSYKIYRSAMVEGTYTPIGTCTSTSFSDKGLMVNTFYYYKVSGVNMVGEGPQSSAVLGKIVVVKPTTVTGLSVKVTSASQLDLNWSAVSGASSYKIYRSAKLKGTYTSIGTSTTTSYSDKEVAKNNTYYYKVSAVNVMGEGVQSSAVLGETKIPGRVTGLSDWVMSISQLEVKWRAVNGASSYKIYRSATSHGTFIQIGTSTTNYFYDKNLAINTAYYYKVSAENVLGEGEQSSAFLGKIVVVKPTTVTGLSVKVSSARQLDLNWSAVSGASSYKIYRSAKLKGTYTSIGTSATTSYSDKEVAKNNTYYYKVSAVNVMGEGVQSSAVLGETKIPGRVTGLSDWVMSISQLEVKWSAVNGASSYKIYRSSTSHGTFIQIGTSTRNYFYDKNLAINTAYYYKVSAENVLGEGVQSSAFLGKIVVAKPTTVTGLSVKVTSANQLDLNWSAVNWASSYKIYRSVKSSGSYTPIGTSATTSYSDKNIESNSKYYYKVSAVNVIGEGKTSTAVLGETKVPGRVAGLSAKVINETEIDLSWSAVSGASQYEIFRSASATGTYTSIGTSTTTSYRNINITPNATYYYKVCAVNGLGKGMQSSVVSGATKNPEEVTDLSVEAIGANQLNLSWSAVSGATSYNIYRSESQSWTDIPIGTSTIPYYSDKGLKINTTYYYRVSGVNAIGEGAKSSTESGRTGHF